MESALYSTLPVSEGLIILKINKMGPWMKW